MITMSQNGKFQLPGFKSTFDMFEKINGEGYFTWAEALHFEGGTNGYYRKPEDKEVVEGILKQARELSKFREYLGRPIIVSSWYRDPVTNARVGGVKDSYHLRGLATDCVVPGLRGYHIANAAKKFGWLGGIGIYSSFCHLDSRGYNSTWYGR